MKRKFIILFLCFCFLIHATQSHNVVIKPRSFVSSFVNNPLYSDHRNEFVYTVIPFVFRSNEAASLKLLDPLFHIERLKSSLLLVNSKNDSKDFDFTNFEVNMMESIRRMIPLTLPSSPSSPSSPLISHGLVTICTCDGESFHTLLSPDIGYNFAILQKSSLSSPSPSSAHTDLDPIVVDTIEYKRLTPSAKLCRWTIDRIPLELRRSDPATETIMYMIKSHSSTSRSGNDVNDDSGDGSGRDINNDKDKDEVGADDDDIIFTEGLTSNVYLLSDDGRLTTAPSSLCLRGSMGELVEEACASIGIEVEHSPITMHKITSANTVAFLTSATKPIQIISSILLPSSSSTTTNTGGNGNSNDSKHVEEKVKYDFTTVQNSYLNLYRIRNALIEVMKQKWIEI